MCRVNHAYSGECCYNVSNLLLDVVSALAAQTKVNSIPSASAKVSTGIGKQRLSDLALRRSILFAFNFFLFKSQIKMI